jgi:hypothetical protein
MFFRPRSKPKVDNQTNLFFNLDEKLEKIKITDIESNSLSYPTLKLVVSYKKESIITVVDSNFVFGANNTKISRFPFFVCNVSLNKIEESIEKLSKEVLFEGIKLINGIYKKKDITTLEGAEDFKTYISKSSFFKKISYDFYLECFKKLIFFSELLFKEVMKEKLKKIEPLDGNTDEELMTIDKYTRENITLVRDLLLSKTSDKYKISGVQSESNNLYQVVNGVIKIEAERSSYSSKSYGSHYEKDYEKDYSTNLKKIKNFVRKNYNTGNFYIIIKKEKLCGSFHCFATCELIDKSKLPQEGLVSTTCVSRKKNIKTYLSKLQKGGRRTNRKRRPRYL